MLTLLLQGDLIYNMFCKELLLLALNETSKVRVMLDLWLLIIEKIIIILIINYSLTNNYNNCLVSNIYIYIFKYVCIYFTVVRAFYPLYKYIAK